MKEAIRQYIEELEERAKYLKIGLTEYAHTDYIKQNLVEIKASIGEINITLATLKSILRDNDKKPLIENSLIDTEETKTENWRLTKYPT